MGHEYSGTVVRTGDNVTEFTAGQKVVEEPIHDCGHCNRCNNDEENVCENFSIKGMHEDGAYANYTTVESRHLHAVPDSVDLRDAAITEPTSVATRAVFDQSDTVPGDDVLVEGPGPIGVLIAVVADSMGANVLVSGLEKDTEYRLPLISEQGIETINSQQQDLETMTSEFTDGIGFDVVFDATGHRSGVEGIDHVRKGGQFVMVGIPNSASEVCFAPAVRGEIEINTSYGSKWHNFEQALQLMENGSVDIDAIVDTSYQVDEPTEAFRSFLDSKTCKPVFTFAD
jgi:L-iditol 2-dehydrogenase